MKKGFVVGLVRVAVLSSGGKDSTYAHWWAILQGWDVISLIRCKIRTGDSMTFQVPATDIVEKQSLASETNYIEFVLSGEENSEMEELASLISENMRKGKILEKLDGLVSGALRSDYQKSRIECMCEELGIHSFSPLWHNNPANHISSLIDDGFKILITSVSSNGLDKSWIGKIINKSNYVELKKLADKYRFNVDGEGGEFETSILNAPHYSSELVCEGEIIWEKTRGHFEFSSINLVK